MVTPQRGALWVRYFGSQNIHRADVFPLPTDQIPQKVERLKKRGDVAQIWYMAGEGDFKPPPYSYEHWRAS